jgi:hypothetical protein
MQLEIYSFGLRVQDVVAMMSSVVGIKEGTHMSRILEIEASRVRVGVP